VIAFTQHLFAWQRLDPSEIGANIVEMHGP